MNYRKPNLVGARARGPTPNDIRHPVTTQHTTAPARSPANRVEPTRRKLHRPQGILPAALELRCYERGGDTHGSETIHG